MVHTAFPRCGVVEVQPLTDGQRNSNFKLRLGPTDECIVLRVYEHDPSLCAKEVDLIRLVAGPVPVPEVIHAEPRGLDDLPPFLLMCFVEGVSFRELKAAGDRDALAQAAFSAGETLAAIGRHTFPKAGWLGPGPSVGPPLLEGADPMPRFVDLCLESPSLRDRVPPDLRDRTHDLVWSQASQLAAVDTEARLVHGDFSKRNLLVQSVAGRWTIVAVLDWEFAVSSSPLADIGNFLRYDLAAHRVAEPHFPAGYMSAGGILPEDWLYLARLVDLIAVCECLTHDELPEAVTAELVEVVRATVENRQ